VETPEGWSLDDSGKVLVRRLTFKDFAQAFAFLTRVAMHAEKADHHPDFCVSWNKVDFRLTTHSAGGVTQRDVELAKAIDAMAKA